MKHSSKAFGNYMLSIIPMLEIKEYELNRLWSTKTLKFIICAMQIEDKIHRPDTKHATSKGSRTANFRMKTII
jgi:hypothetical protein